MTVETATNFTISHTMDHGIVEELESAFDGFRSRIAMLSVEACGTLTSMFSPLGPEDEAIIDIQAIEAVEAIETVGAIEVVGAIETVECERVTGDLVAASAQEASILEFVSA